MKQKGGKLKTLSWIFFDFGNSAFTTVIVTAFYVLYFKSVVMEGSARGDFFWGLSITIAMLFIGLSAPVLGAIADSGSYRKMFMILFALLSIVFTSMLSFVSAGMVFAGMLFFILANIGFEGSNVFYNSFLPEVSTVENRGRISGWAWGVGYIGGILCLIVILPLVKGGFGADNIFNVKLSFVIVSIQYLIFCLPAFILLKDWGQRKRASSAIGYVRGGLGNTLKTLKEIRKYKDLFFLIIAFFIYNDGIHTVIVFAAAFANDTLGFTVAENIQFLIIINVVAAFGAIGFGYIVDKIGAKRSILITLVLWMIAILGAYFVETKSTYYMIGVLVGIALGSSQSATRTLVGLFAPKKKAAEFFGFSAIGGKFSAILGPILFGAVSSATGNQRTAILVVLVFFVVGFVLLLRVNEKRGIELARREDNEGQA